MKNTTTVGKQAESTASKYLIERGYALVARNYRNRFCEIDIIVRNEEYICFVEVKYRSSDNFGGGLGAVEYFKQGRLKKSAEYWLSEHQEYSGLQPRIDVIAVNQSNVIEHIENAVC